MRNGATADDLTQEVLIKAYQRLPQMRDTRRLMGWVIKIARHAVADFDRQVKRAGALEEAYIALLPTPTESTEGEER